MLPTDGSAALVAPLPNAKLPAAPPIQAEAPPQRQRAVIEPPKRWPRIDLAELWRYRELFWRLVWRDVKVRYKQTFLGVAWAVIQPALMMIVFVVFFHRIAGLGTGGLPAEIFFLSGLLPWFFFQQAVAAGGSSVIGSEHLITKIYFPRLIIPVAAVFAAAFDSLVAMSLLGVMCAIYGVMPNVNILMLPVVYVLIAMLAIGLGTLIAALNVVYRDVRYIVPFALQLGLFATPTIYMPPPKGHEGRTLNLIADLNPMTALVSAFRGAAVGEPIPWAALGISALVAVVVMVAGCMYFRKTEDRFADII